MERSRLREELRAAAVLGQDACAAVLIGWFLATRVGADCFIQALQLHISCKLARLKLSALCGRSVMTFHQGVPELSKIDSLPSRRFTHNG